MATVFEVHVVHADHRYAAQAAHAAFDLLDGLERDLSRFLPNSDIARINHLAAGDATRVSASTLECLVIARHVGELTGGAFDISMGTGLAALEIDVEEMIVRATTAGVRLDLGGIGKGYAVDRMAELLEEWGLNRALVHGGFSSVLTLDPPDTDDGWPLTLSDPAAPSKVLADLAMRQTALAASGLRKGEHIVEPRTGEPARQRSAVWVALRRPQAHPGTPTGDGPRPAAAAIADALTTAFMVLRSEEIDALCARSPGLEAWLLERHGDDQDGEPRLRHLGG
jgi:thiamine biosynthesis lipoprotein